MNWPTRHGNFQVPLGTDWMPKARSWWVQHAGAERWATLNKGISMAFHLLDFANVTTKLAKPYYMYTLEALDRKVYEPRLAIDKCWLINSYCRCDLLLGWKHVSIISYIHIQRYVCVCLVSVMDFALDFLCIAFFLTKLARFSINWLCYTEIVSNGHKLALAFGGSWRQEMIGWVRNGLDSHIYLYIYVYIYIIIYLQLHIIYCTGVFSDLKWRCNWDL